MGLIIRKIALTVLLVITCSIAGYVGSRAAGFAAAENFSGVAAGIIRPDGEGGWFILDDEDHAPVNLSKVDTHPDHIVVFFAKPFSKLVTFSVGVDDDFARARIVAGASVGLNKIGIVLSDHAGLIDPRTILNTIANIQIKVEGYAAP